MIKVGVIGCGYWGPNLVRNFFKFRDCEVVAVADLRPERLDYIHRLYPSLKRTTDALEIVHDPEIDAVAVATPVMIHFGIAKEALRAGKDVLVTKPMTRTVAEAVELIELATRNRRVLMVDHTFIYSGPVRKIRELIDQGELGRIYYYDSVRVNLGLFQNDVNVLWDLAPHDFSILLYLIDKDPIAVSAVAARPVNSENYSHESVAYITVRFADETIAHIHVSWLSPVKIRRALIGGSRRMVVYDHLDPDNQVKVYDKGVEVRSSEERYQALVQYRLGNMYAPKVDQTEALELECRHFLDCIREGRRPITDGYAGLRVVQLLEAAQQSIERNGEAVSLVPMNENSNYARVMPTLPRRAEGATDASSSEYKQSPVNCATPDGKYRLIAADVKMGKNVKVYGFVNLYGCEIGDNSKIGAFVEIQKGAKIGNNCKISSHTFICEGVTIEDEVFVGHHVVFINDKYPRATNERGELQTEADWKVQPTIVRRKASIGSGAVILCGVTIGEGAIVGAGSVVTKDVPPNTIVAGNPARVLRPVLSEFPSVSIIIPCLNEERFIGACLDSVIANDYPKDRLEVLVVDGMSKDKTRAIVEDYARRHPFVRLLDNPKRISAAAFNRGIATASADLIMLVNAHSTYPKNYVSACVRFLREYQADNVGGVFKIMPGGETTLAKAIALVLAHPFGSGNAYVKTGAKQPRWADTAAFGCYRKEVFLKIGRFNEELGGTEDMDLNWRLRQAGGRILLVPDIVISYYADSDLRSFWRHNFSDGLWITYRLKFGSRVWSWRHWLPAAFVLGLVGSITLSAVFPSLRWLFAGITGAYIAANLGASLHLALRERRLAYLVAAPIVFATRHVAHGLGALLGLILLPLPGKRWHGRRSRKG